MDIGLDEDDEITDIREQIFHNTVREQIVSTFNLTQFKEFNIFKMKFGKIVGQRTVFKCAAQRIFKWLHEIQCVRN